MAVNASVQSNKREQSELDAVNANFFLCIGTLYRQMALQKLDWIYILSAKIKN